MAIQVKKSDIVIVLVILAAVIVGLFSVFVSCQDLPNGTALTDSTFDPGGIVGSGSSGSSGSSGKEKSGSGGKEKSGSGAPPEAKEPIAQATIILKDADDVVLNADEGSTDGHLKFSDTGSKLVSPTITGAPAGYDYLKWTITGVAEFVDGDVGAAETTESKATAVFVRPRIPLQGGTATVTVTNCNNSGDEGVSATFTVGIAPGDVTTADFTTITSSSITIEWDAVPGATGYNVYTGGGDQLNGEVITGTSPTFTFVDTGLEPGTEYEGYLITAVNDYGESDWVYIGPVTTLSN
jgi:hypothetical protein